MGVQESKQSFGSTPNLGSTGSLRRSGLYKSTTVDQIQVRHELVRSIQSDIDIFAGKRTDERYKELQQILIKTSADLEQIKKKSNKERTRDRCYHVQKEVQASIQRLEAKLAENEQTERGLDLAAVESNSFVNQSFGQPAVATNHFYGKPELTRSMDDIEFQLENLEREVQIAIDLEDTKQFVILEKKITILYGDLVMIQIDEHTPLSERREGFERRLINCNNKIKKCKRKLTKRASELPIGPTSVDEIDKTQQRLSDLEKEAVTFGGINTDKRYKELEQLLERYWTSLYATDVFTDEERQKRDTTVEKTKEILQQLRKRADENERQAKALQMLNTIENHISLLTKEVLAFRGNSTDSEYTRLDQDSRRLWANLNEIEDVNDRVRKSKITAITNIKNILKELAQNTKKRESQDFEEVQQKQLLKQVEEFQNHWKQLSHNLNEKGMLDPSTSISIIEILEAVLEGLRKKARALTVLENRKSNTSLVIARISDSNELYTKYKSAPDLVPQQLGIPEADTKVPPLNKTKVIAEMHSISNDAQTLLQQIKQTHNLKDENRQLLENNLNQCMLNLNSIEYNKKNETIESNKRRVIKIIEEGYKALEEKIAFADQARTSTAHEIMDVDAEIQFWRQRIKNFTGTAKDKQYEKIKQGLAESLMKLQVLDDNQISKQESIQHIQQHNHELETKLAENQAKEKCAEVKRRLSQDIKTTVEQVQKLKAQVDRFSGTYKGILYKQIEDNLKSCHDKLDTFETKSEERLDTAKEQTKQKIQKYLTILDEKSVKPKAAPPTSTIQTLQKLQDSNVLKESSTYQRVYSEDVSKKPQVQTADSELPHHKINTIRENLVVIKEKVERFSGKFNDPQYISVQKEIEESLVKLKSINDSGYPHVTASKTQYIDYIEKLQQYFKDQTLASDGSELREADEV